MTTACPIDGDAAANEQQRISEEVRTICERRAPIDQAMGMLMLIYGIDAIGAFGLLQWQSQLHNVKLRLLAEEILRELIESSKGEYPVRRAVADDLLLTVNRRIRRADGT